MSPSATDQEWVPIITSPWPGQVYGWVLPHTQTQPLLSFVLRKQWTLFPEKATSLKTCPQFPVLSFYDCVLPKLFYWRPLTEFHWFNLNYCLLPHGMPFLSFICPYPRFKAQRLRKLILIIFQSKLKRQKVTSCYSPRVPGRRQRRALHLLFISAGSRRGRGRACAPVVCSAFRTRPPPLLAVKCHAAM